MCGLIGYHSFQRELPIEAALKGLRHRGPDASRINRYRTSAGGSVVLGHARLSILDLSHAADQPFVSSCGSYAIIFNGEIYNHVELRQQLNSEGVSFATRSDTEVLLAAYAKWGKSALAKLDGMFAFVIYDMAKQILFFGRDQFGIKPLYFYKNSQNRVFAFASEIPAIANLVGGGLEPDPDDFAMFLLNGWLYEPATGIRQIQKLGPGQYATLDLGSGSFQQTTYYDQIGSPRSDDLPGLLHETAERQMRADVPVGLFFSGGLDSSALAAASPQQLTGLFVEYEADPGTVGLDQIYAEKIAAAIGMPMRVMKHAPSSQSAEDIIADFRAVAAGTQEPISDYTYSATRDLSALAVECGFKVMLSGMGGDEIFAGYPRLQLARYFGGMRHVRPFARLLTGILRRNSVFSKKAARLEGFLTADAFVEAYTQLVGYFSTREVDALLGSNRSLDALDRTAKLLAPASKLSPLKQALYLDRFGFLAHNLTTTDRASMSQSLEVRVPFLTTKLADWAFHQDDAILTGIGSSKIPLRKFAVERLGKELINRPKQGFNPPLDQKIKILGRDRINSEIKSGPLIGCIDIKMAINIVDQHFDGLFNNTYRIWQLLYFSYWLEALQAQSIESRMRAC